MLDRVLGIGQSTSSQSTQDQSQNEESKIGGGESFEVTFSGINQQQPNPDSYEDMLQQVTQQQADYDEDRDEEDEEDEESEPVSQPSQTQIDQVQSSEIKEARDFICELYEEARVEIAYQIMNCYGLNRFKRENKKKITSDIDFALNKAGFGLPEDKISDLEALISALMIQEMPRTPAKVSSKI